MKSTGPVGESTANIRISYHTGKKMPLQIKVRKILRCLTRQFQIQSNPIKGANMP